MKQKTLSAGIVIVRREQHEYRYLILRCYDYWDFPKGMVEPGESPMAAACREVREETGIEQMDFPWDREFIETAPYGRGKVARYYLALTAQDSVELLVNPQLGFPEHHEFRWLDYHEAKALMPPRLKPVIDWTYHLIGS